MEFSTNSFMLLMDDGTEVCVNRWVPEGEIKGVIQLSHGMVEHSLRYDWLGSLLAEQGFVFQAHDHRGHGKTAQNALRNGTGMFGYLADKDGFNRVVHDLDNVVQKAKTDFEGKKVFLLAHSFGSFVGQAYCEQYGNQIDGCILSGTAGPRPLLVSEAKIAAGIMSLFCGKKKQAPFLNSLAFGSYNNRIPDRKTKHDWLSRDAEIVKLYESDSWCGFTPTIGFFQDMFSGLSQIHAKKNMKKIPSTLPILIAYGTGDPVGSYGKTPHELAKIYASLGIKDVSEKSYEGARHEILNEINKNEVTDDMINWIKKRN